VNVSTPLAALVKPSNFKPPDIILAAFQLLLKLVQRTYKKPPKYSPNGLTTNNLETFQLVAVTLFCEPAL
jgi:hypothetical protein